MAKKKPVKKKGAPKKPISNSKKLKSSGPKPSTLDDEPDEDLDDSEEGGDRPEKPRLP